MQNLDYFRELAEWSFKVYVSMEAESVIAVSNSCDLAWPVQFREGGRHVDVTPLQRNAYVM